MEQKTHKTLYSAHAWIGVISGILLFIVTFSGIPALFDHEIEYWQYPTYGEVSNNFSSDKKEFDLEKSIMAAKNINFDYDDYFIQPASDINNHIILGHFSKDKEPELRYLDANQYNEFSASPSELNHLLSHLHTNLHIPGKWGRYLVGLSGMAMLLAIIAGIFIHVKWRKEFVMLRPKRSWRLLLTDQHKLLGLWSLPFTFILAFTGTILGLLGLISPILALAAFNGDVEKATIAVLGPKAELTAEYTPVYPLNKLWQQLKIDLPDSSIEFIQVSGLKIQDESLVADRGGIIKFNGYHKHKLSNLESVTYNLSTGEKIHQGSFVEKGPFQRVFAAVTPLHYVLFGNIWLKVFYALSALAACGLILTGNMLWLNRRGHNMEHWLSKLTLGACGGLVVSTSLTFLSSQLIYAFKLPEGAHLHHYLEECVFWSSWGAVIILPFIYQNGFKLSHILLRLTSLGFLGVLLADGLINQRWIGFTEGWIFNVQLGILFTALLFIYLDWKMPNSITSKEDIKNMRATQSS
ncbi:MAG: PepSY domain-containing protein [Oleispira sp.]|nr:PepSY domain-containing protein [Oleispira sp.]MBL4880520.1 PepSY domain-containing protein [Oleispira sp.]